MTTDLHADAIEIFRSGVAAAEPETITHHAVSKKADILCAQRLTVIATGKAALSMMRGALAALPSAPVVAIAVTNAENVEQLHDVQVYAAGHPVPDEGGAVAARAVMNTVGALSKADTLLMLVSGGTSAVLPAPADGLTLADEIAATEGLLASGAPIDVVNAVRRRISRIKGGGLSTMAGEASVVTLMLSDVPGDDPSAIGSGPTIAPSKETASLPELLLQHDLETHLPERIGQFLQTDEALPSSKKAIGPRIAEVVGSNAISLQAVAAEASKRGFDVQIVSHWLDGDVGEATRVIRDAALVAKNRPIALIAGGETTVQLVGSGKGGRNQEMALRFALEAASISGPWVFLSGGTDGRDGPTDAAGGIVDHETLKRIGMDAIAASLANNDAYHILKQHNDLLMTGSTGTNVADLQILLLA